ncbi:MAG: hypothetical protein GYA15_03365 [Leptolinea sp.]|jgi:hypothetical protein|nr:hypothetical protein [Leptolinea sp.]
MKERLMFMFFLLTGMEALIMVAWLAGMPAEAEHALFLGFSLPRLILMGGLISASLAVLSLAFTLQRSALIREKCEKLLDNRYTGIIAGLVSLAAWILILLPAYQWGRYGGYKERLLPVIFWLLLAGIQTYLMVIWSGRTRRTASLRSTVQQEPALVRAWWITMSVFTLAVLAVSFFRVGLIPDIVYWNDINVPLLGIQIIAVLFGSVIFLFGLARLGFFLNRNRTGFYNRLPDLLICLFIWGLAVIAWTQVEMPHSYFAPGPYPPNEEMYPFSDAAGYDRLAQIAVIGGGVGTRQFEYVDKPFYVAFLAVIHLIAGNRMAPVVGLQVAVIALLPVVVYLMGRKIHGRLAGVLAAGFVIFREINNIQGTLWVLSSNSRVLMSESLVMVLLALFVLMILQWFRDERCLLQLLAAGGFLGLAALVRLNPLLLMPVTGVAILIFFGKQWKKGILYGAVFAALFTLTLVPWMMHSNDRHDKPFFFMGAMKGVVLTQRTYYALNTPAPVQTPVAGGTSVQPTPQVEPPQQPVNKIWNKITGISNYVTAHFFHNMISSMALFPTSLSLDSLERTIKAPSSYWSAEWNGSLSGGQIILIYFVLMILSTGLAAGWSRVRWAGLVPAGFFLAYNLATAAARTSGGRYILPADWVFLLYFALGLAQIVEWLATWLSIEYVRPLFETDALPPLIAIKRWQIQAIAGLFLLAGALPVLFDRLVLPRYQPVDKSTLAAELQQQGRLTGLGISRDKLETFLSSTAAVATRGMGLYPRYYTQDHGEPDQFSPMRGQPFPRLVMDIIGADTTTSGIIPLIHSPQHLPNGTDVLAIGCRGELNDDWLALITADEVILRSPAAEWVCPVTLPTCDNNRNCR